MPAPDRAPLTLGSIHHVAHIVADAEGEARRFESTFGWQRYVDEDCNPDTAEKIGVLVGNPANGVARVRVIMLRHPDRPDGTVEFTEVEATPGAPPPDSPPATFVVAFSVPDTHRAFEELVAGGYDPVCPPVQLAMAGVRPWCATVRGGHGSVIEVIDGLRR